MEPSAAHLACRRALARDDLLLVAHDAEQAIDVLRRENARQYQQLGRHGLFALAFEHHLQAAESTSKPALRGQYLAHAAAIGSFCQRVQVELPGNLDPVELYRLAAQHLQGDRAREFADRTDGQLGDFTLGVIINYQWARALRIQQRLPQAQEVAWQAADFFNGMGAEPYRAHHDFEVGAALLSVGETGQAVQVFRALSERGKYWSVGRQSKFATRNRYCFIQALAALSTGQLAEAEALLLTALRHLLQRGEDIVAHDLQKLSLTMTLVDVLSLEPEAARDGRSTARAERFLRRAIDLTEKVRGRWRIVSRSRVPLSIVFRQVYGDLATLAARRDTAGGARLGLAVALSAKQTGFAALMRTERSLMNNRAKVLLNLIVDAESRDVVSESTLEDYRQNLVDHVSPMLADLVLPLGADTDSVFAALRGQYALDYVRLEDTSGRSRIFCSVLHPDGAVSFSQVEPGEAFEQYFKPVAGLEEWVNRLDEERPTLGPDWRGLANELLPAELLDAARAATRSTPLDLVISPHAELSLIPWAALMVDPAGTRLIERAVLAQTPVLTCLAERPEPARVRGPALVKLVAQTDSHDGLDIRQESAAWSLSAEPDGEVPLSRCHLDGGRSEPVPRELIAELREAGAEYGLVHIAAHGEGDGLAQTMRLPEPLTAGQALEMHWPGAALLASCHVSRVDNFEDAEPFGLAIAALARGADCVVAGLHAVSNPGAGLIAAEIVRSMTVGAELPVLLRCAQLSVLGRSPQTPAYEWGLFAAVVR